MQISPDRFFSFWMQWYTLSAFVQFLKAFLFFSQSDLVKAQGVVRSSNILKWAIYGFKLLLINLFCPCKTEIISDRFVFIETWIHTDIYRGIIVPLTFKKHATKLCYIDLFVSTWTSKDFLKQTIASKDIQDSVARRLLTLTLNVLLTSQKHWSYRQFNW